MRTSNKNPPDPKPPWLGLYFDQNPTIFGLSWTTLVQFILDLGVTLPHFTLSVIITFLGALSYCF